MVGAGQNLQKNGFPKDTMSNPITTDSDGSVRIDAAVVRDDDETALRAVLATFYGDSANIQMLVQELKDELSRQPGNPTITLNPIGLKPAAAPDD